MEEKKKDWSYEKLFSGLEEKEQEKAEKAEDLLTDPEAIAAAQRADEGERAHNFGGKLRSAREVGGFSLEEIAKKTGINRDLLEQVEAGQAFLPLGELVRLSKALSLRMSDVISTGEEPFTIVMPHQRKSFTRFGEAKMSSHGYEFESLASEKKGRTMEPFAVTLFPTASAQPSSHDGQEFIYVLEGEVEIIVNDTVNVLGPGGAAYYDSTSRHLVKAHGDKPAKIIGVLTG